MSREARERMAEDYITTRDALVSVEVMKGGKAKGDHVPSYVRQPKPPKGLGDLLRDHPGAVVREPSEFRN